MPECRELLVGEPLIVIDDDGGSQGEAHNIAMDTIVYYHSDTGDHMPVRCSLRNVADISAISRHACTPFRESEVSFLPAGTVCMLKEGVRTTTFNPASRFTIRERVGERYCVKCNCGCESIDYVRADQIKVDSLPTNRPVTISIASIRVVDEMAFFMKRELPVRNYKEI
jgi:hypothetical protein